MSLDATGREKAYKLNNDAANPQSLVSGGYVSFVAHLWVGNDGKLIRGTIEDVHTGKRLALDLSELVAFLQTSLAYSPGQANQGEKERNEEQPSERLGEGSSDADIQDDHATE